MDKKLPSTLVISFIAGLLAFFAALVTYMNMPQVPFVPPEARDALIEKNRRLGEEYMQLMKDQRAGKEVDDGRLIELQKELFFGSGQ